MIIKFQRDEFRNFVRDFTCQNPTENFHSPIKVRWTRCSSSGGFHAFPMYCLIVVPESNRDSLLEEQSSYFIQKPLNKSSTEVKFDRYFDENIGGVGGRSHYRRHWYESPGMRYNTSSVSMNKSNQDFNNHLQIPSNGTTTMMRKRKISTISNLSSLDYSGSYLYLHAVSK